MMEQPRRKGGKRLAEPSAETARIPDISGRIRKRRAERVRNRRAKRSVQGKNTRDMEHSPQTDSAGETVENTTPAHNTHRDAAASGTGDIIPVFARAHGKRKSGGKTASGTKSGNVRKNGKKAQQTSAANAAETGKNMLLSAAEAIRRSEGKTVSESAGKQSGSPSAGKAASMPPENSMTAGKSVSSAAGGTSGKGSAGESAGIKHRRRDLYVPLGILSVILLFCVWSGMYLSVRTQQWGEQLDYVETLVRRSEWDGAVTALSADYEDWYASRGLLHVLCRHDVVDSAEELYRRCLILLLERDSGNFLTDLTSLRHQLESIAERERFSVGNIL